MSDEKVFSPGLAGVIGAETAVSLVDGANGKLLYRGYPIEEVVSKGAMRTCSTSFLLASGIQTLNWLL